MVYNNHSENRTNPIFWYLILSFVFLLSFGFSFSADNEEYLYVWGENYQDRMGVDTLQDSIVDMMLLTEDKKWRQISTHIRHSWAIDENGHLWGWGENTAGQLGDGTKENKNLPVLIDSTMLWSQVTVGLFFSIGIAEDGSLWATGANNDGQLGIGEDPFFSSDTLVRVGSENDWTSIESGYGHTLALKSNGTLWSWGWNTSGQLGLSDTLERNIPTQIGTDSDWVKISTWFVHSGAIKDDGSLWTWGDNGKGELGFDGEANLPTLVDLGTDWEEISFGSSFSIAKKADGTIWSCGWNNFGTLGLGNSISDTSRFTQIGSDKDWRDIKSNIYNVLAIKQDGTQWGWGDNIDEILLNDDTSVFGQPVIVNYETDWTDVYPGVRRFYAKKQSLLSIPLIQYEVSGSVVDNLGLPIEGVLVDFGNGDTVRTDQFGQYSYQLTTGNYTSVYSLERFGFSPATIDFSITGQDTVLAEVFGSIINPSNCIVLDNIDLGTTIFDNDIETELVSTINIVNQCNDPLTIIDIFLDNNTSNEFSIISDQVLPISLSFQDKDTLALQVKYIPKNIGADVARFSILTDVEEVSCNLSARAIEKDSNTKITYISLKPNSKSVENGDTVRLYLSVDSTVNIFSSTTWELTTSLDSRIASGLRFVTPDNSIIGGKDVFLDLNRNLKEFILRGSFDPDRDTVLGYFEFIAALAEKDTLFFSSGQFDWKTDSIIVRPSFSDFIHVLPCLVDGKRLITRKKDNLSITNIFPNPTNSTLNLKISAKENDVISLFNYLGKKVYSQKINRDFNDEELSLEMDNIPTGNYILELNTITGKESHIITFEK
ncbi:MAG: hypothetical protein Kapaf2KO_23430 [Candidatus Kapaibacteriales bacterium]